MFKKTDVKKSIWDVEVLNVNLIKERRNNNTKIMTEEQEKEADKRWGTQYRKPRK